MGKNTNKQKANQQQGKSKRKRKKRKQRDLKFICSRYTVLPFGELIDYKPFVMEGMLCFIDRWGMESIWFGLLPEGTKRVCLYGSGQLIQVDCYA